MIPYAELETFFCDLVSRAQRQGITCGITSGMACVHFGVAATTKDCDVLCTPSQSDAFRKLIAETTLHGISPGYRGNISPPLDSRWLQGGWTSHISWKTKPEETCLDIFGIAPRASTPWEAELSDIYASRHTVAEMKRTNREKDWPFATSLGGLILLLEKKPSGWLHLHDLDVLRACSKGTKPPEMVCLARPLLRLAPFPASATIQMKRLLLAERAFWGELDALRIRVFQKHLRPYTSAVRKNLAGKTGITFRENHEIRLATAEQFLPHQPLVAYGLARMVHEATAIVSQTVGVDVAKWLPTAIDNFFGLPVPKS